MGAARARDGQRKSSNVLNTLCRKKSSLQVVRGYKTELDLNDLERTACLKHAGASRFAYNWGLARSQEAYRTTGKRPTAIDLHKQQNALKPTDFPWMYELRYKNAN